MEKKKSYDYVIIGLQMRYISSLSKETGKDAIFEDLDILKRLLVDVGFVVSLHLLNYLITELKKNTESINPTDKLPSAITSDLKNELASLESTIFAESNTKYVHIIPNRRFVTEYLLEQPQKLLKDTVFSKLSDIAKFDFSSACRCISLGEATASAFHILRATEDTLKQYYYKYKKTNRLKKPMWGPMTIELRAKKTNKPSETILNALDVVRVSYRNPTQHPEAKYDIESAQDLFGVCIDLINKMVLDS